MATSILFETIEKQFIGMTTQWSGVAGQLVTAVMAPIVVGASLLVMWHGFNILRGAGGQHHLLDVFFKTFRVFAVVGLALAAGAYAGTIVGFFESFRDNLVAMFVPGAINAFSALDTVIDGILKTYDSTWNFAKEHISFGVFGDADISGLVALVCWVLMALSLAIFCAICAVNLVVIAIALKLLFALGPIFIAAYAFRATERFTDAWIGGVLKYVFTTVVITAVVSVGLGLLNSYVGTLGASPDAIDYVPVALGAIASSVCLIYIATKMPEIAGNIVGGIGLSAMSPAMAAGPFTAAKAIFAGGTGAAGRAAGNTASYGAGAAAASKPARAIAASRAGQAAAGLASKASSVGRVLSGTAGSAYSAGQGLGTVTAGRAHVPAK